MYIILTDKQIYKARNLKGIQRQVKGLFELNDFHTIGQDHVINMNESDLTFVQDKKSMSIIPIKNLYRGENIKMYMLIILVAQLFTFLKP